MLLSSVHSAHTTSFLSFTSTLLSSAASSSICRSALSFFSLNSLAYNKCKTKVNNEHCLNFQVIILQSKTRKRGCHGCLPFTWPVPLWENGEQKLRTGIVFNICTIQFLLPKTGAKALNWYKKLRFHNGTRIHVCNIPSFVPQNFPRERPKTSCFIYSFSSRIFRKHFCQSLHGKQPIFPYHTDTPYVG